MVKILMSSVFGPFGVDDDWGRKENVMELFHNQVTREQGMFSLRFHHPSFGLHLLAENIDAETHVLDFPTQARFIAELRKGYDYVGISFIAPNFVKARRMAELVRQHAPATQIILGGHGTHIPDLEKLIDADHICRGEGVRWLRELLGEDPAQPIRHPAVKSALSKSMMGVRRPVEAAVLIPGVGCPNACRFCATSFFFDKRYDAYFDSGDALFAAAVDVEKRLGMSEFFIMDENFLKREERVRRFLELMEDHDKHWKLSIFSSAETIGRVGVDLLRRLGVEFLWLGVESKREVYTKNEGVDFKALVAELRDAGIMVLASGILFLEHHDRETINEDIEFMTSLDADFVQFMQLGPMPVTELFADYQQRGLLIETVPHEERHGQDRIWFRHPHFERDETHGILKRAFEHEYHANGPSLFRLFETTARGAERDDGGSPRLAIRRQAFVDRCRDYRHIIRWMRFFAPTAKMRAQAVELGAHYERILGKETLLQRAVSYALFPLVAAEALRTRMGWNMYQPPTVISTFGRPERALANEPAAAPELCLTPGLLAGPPR
mgnify:CR=1 FL=1